MRKREEGREGGESIGEVKGRWFGIIEDSIVRVLWRRGREEGEGDVRSRVLEGEIVRS